MRERCCPPRRADAEVVLPLANTAEEDGTFVNRDGRVQRYVQAKPTPGMARPAWWVLGELRRRARGQRRIRRRRADVFDALAAAVERVRRACRYDRLGLRGRTTSRRARR